MCKTHILLRVSLKIDEKRALSEFRVLYPKSSTRIIPGKNISVVELKLFTGRKHQLRIHCAEGLKCGILGDFLYSGKTDSSFYSVRPNSHFPIDHNIFVAASKIVFTLQINIDSFNER
jgi:23S rRNA-/tRNA-specific pseudouridylate synthase